MRKVYTPERIRVYRYAVEGGGYGGSRIAEAAMRCGDERCVEAVVEEIAVPA